MRVPKKFMKPEKNFLRLLKKYPGPENIFYLDLKKITWFRKNFAATPKKCEIPGNLKK